MSMGKISYFEHSNVNSIKNKMLAQKNKKRIPFKRLGFLDDLIHLIFPSTCLICENELASSEKDICSFCDSNLNRSNYHLFSEATPMDKLFWGRADIKATYTHLIFDKNKGSQNVLFNLKYKNNPELGVHFGTRMAVEMKQMTAFESVDSLIPVPLHYKKAFIRGYNQSEVIADGISEVLGIPVDTTSIIRTKHTETQTKKSRFQRWDNVDSIFDIKSNLKKYKHVVLVDDVITTGSTMEALIQSIHQHHPKLEISVVTLAIA